MSSSACGDPCDAALQVQPAMSALRFNPRSDRQSVLLSPQQHHLCPPPRASHPLHGDVARHHRIEGCMKIGPKAAMRCQVKATLLPDRSPSSRSHLRTECLNVRPCRYADYVRKNVALGHMATRRTGPFWTTSSPHREHSTPRGQTAGISETVRVARTLCQTGRSFPWPQVQ